MDTIANMLTIIRNGAQARKQDVLVPHSKIKEMMLSLMKREGYITAFDKVTVDTHPMLKVRLSYDAQKRPVITKLVRISKPGRRVYVKYDQITPVIRGLGISIISTSQGLLTDKEAVKQKLGGEMLCKIW